MISLIFGRSPRPALPALTLCFLSILLYQASGSFALLTFFVTQIRVPRPAIHPLTPCIIKMTHAFFIMDRRIAVRIPLVTPVKNPALIRPLAHRCLLSGDSQKVFMKISTERAPN